MGRSCRLWPDRLWPNRLWPNLALLVFWPNFLNPKNPNPKDFFRNLGEGADPSGPHPSGPTCSGFGVVVVVGLDFPGPPSAGPLPLRWTRMLDFGQFDFDQLAEIELAEVENKLAEVEIGRSRTDGVCSVSSFSVFSCFRLFHFFFLFCLCFCPEKHLP